MTHRFTSLTLTLAILLSASIAGADGTHEDWSLRLSLGIGSAGADTGTDGSSARVAGAQSVAVGHSIYERTLLYVELGGTTTYAARAEDRAYGAAALGLAHYTPGNWFVAGSAGVAFTFPPEQEDPEGGLALSATFGHEWWTSSTGALGLAAQITSYRLDTETVNSGILLGTMTLD